MALDPRRFTFKADSCAAKDGGTGGSTLKNAFNSLGKLGDLEILNDVGAGEFGAGLRSLSQTSNILSSGVGAVSDIFSSPLVTDEAGGNEVLNIVGIGANNITNELTNLNPGVVNRGVGAAKDLFTKVKTGDFNAVTDAPQLVADLKNLGTYASKLVTPGAGENTREFTLCEPSPYAMDLIAKHPKYKYLFIVDFKFSTPYNKFGDLDFAFVVKQSERPNVRFEYEEINMYNFRTKIIKRMEYMPITMRFYDDNHNQIMQFYNAYLRAMSPISNVNGYDVDHYEENSMDYTAHLNQSNALGTPTHNYSASTGPLQDNKKSVIKQIKLIQVYREGNLMNIYNMYNPRIEELQLDELDMAEGGAGSEISLQMSYDGLYIAPGVPTNTGAQESSNAESFNIGTATSKGGQRPLKTLEQSGTVASDPNVPASASAEEFASNEAAFADLANQDDD